MSLPSFNGKRQRQLARRSTEDARQYTYRVIRDCILEFTVLPGQKLNENDFASLLDVSRTPIHETFIRLSRENLVDIIPRRGAFVSRMNGERIKQAVWIHAHLGTSAIESIYIRHVSPDDLRPLYNDLNEINRCLGMGQCPDIPGFIKDFYMQIYILAQDMDLIWESLQKLGIDMERLMTLAIHDSKVAEGFLCEMRELADALAGRDNDHATQIYGEQMNQILRMLPSIQERRPEYFSDL